MNRLADKVCLVTGAGSGIGQATAIAFAEEGAIVLLADRDEEGVSHRNAHAYGWSAKPA
ncbi:SDR family NAD(P)-dependent oxidoreductase [Spirosoma linguale]|uniref:SDR family NAD(P)-dependent oxidoreductase n=1 Tax=Spirosoma linguale TaxID=108 RepID=UPI0001A3C5F5